MGGECACVSKIEMSELLNMCRGFGHCGHVCVVFVVVVAAVHNSGFCVVAVAVALAVVVVVMAMT